MGHGHDASRTGVFRALTDPILGRFDGRAVLSGRTALASPTCVARRSEADRVIASTEQLGVSRIQEIEWTHPRLRRLSDAARLVYACLVDGCSCTARETLESVELVWRNRYRARERYSATTEMKEALDEICLAVEELISAGLLILLDRSSIFAGWVMKPWENPPS